MTWSPPFVISDLARPLFFWLPSAMFLSSRSPLQGKSLAILFAILFSSCAYAAPSKLHTIIFGKWITISYSPTGSEIDEEQPTLLKIRPMLIDARIKEFTFGLPHEVTERLFVVQRIFRVNDTLPQDSLLVSHWQWERGGWLLVDRLTGRISPLNLPDFDAIYSVVSWYRDYAAYCGISEDGKKTYAVVAQLGRRKPVVKKLLDIHAKNEANNEEVKETSDSACPSPSWQRTPIRVTFEPALSSKETFAIRGHVVDVIAEAEDNQEEAEK